MAKLLRGLQTHVSMYQLETPYQDTESKFYPYAADIGLHRLYLIYYSATHCLTGNLWEMQRLNYIGTKQLYLIFIELQVQLQYRKLGTITFCILNGQIQH